MNKEEFRDPYASQNRRDAAIAEREAATYTPDTLPEHLKDAMAAAEAHFAATAPGKCAVTTTVEVEPPHQDTPPEPVEMYFDSTTGDEHVINQVRTREQAAIDQARKEARRQLAIQPSP